MRRKEEKGDSVVQGNKLPLDVVLIEGGCQSYCYTSIMAYQLIRAHFEGRLKEFVSQVLEERKRLVKESQTEA